MKKRKTTQRTEKQILAILKRYKKSGLSISAFCRKNELATTTLSQWLKQRDMPQNKFNPGYPTYNNTEKKKIIKEYIASGKPKATFCKDKSFVPSTLTLWMDERGIADPNSIKKKDVQKLPGSSSPKKNASQKRAKRTPEECKKVVEHYYASGYNQKEYAEKHNLTQGNLCYMIIKYGDKCARPKVLQKKSEYYNLKKDLVKALKPYKKVPTWDILTLIADIKGLT